mgnify:CR=1 FL=1
MNNTLWTSIVLGLLLLVSVRVNADVRLLEESGEKLVLRMEVPNAELQRVKLKGRNYVTYSLNGFKKTAEPGSPEVPFTKVQLLVPTGMAPVLEVKNRTESQAEYLPWDVAVLSRLPAHDGRGRTVAKELTAYRKVYGVVAVEIEDVSYAGNEKIATLVFWPVRYDARRRMVQRVQLLDVEVSFKPMETQEIPPVAGLPLGIAKYFVLNHSQFQKEITVNNKVDLVIAHASHQAALKRYIDFKKSRGRTVRDYYVGGVTAITASEVKQIIAAEYRKAEPPNNTLFIGNVDQIPAFYESNQGSVSDFKYQLLDAGEVPDLSLGRVPAHNALELNSFIDKAIQREEGMHKVGEVLLTAGRDTSMGCPANVTLVGQKLKAAGADVNVTQKYMTQVSSQAVFDAYNQNPNIAVYDGHGDHTGMLEIPLKISNLNVLTNKVHPIILDIACLNANWSSSGASRRNFAEMILLQPNAGSSGIMASGGSGWGHEFFVTIGATMAKSRQNLQNDSIMNEIGRIIMVAKVAHGQQDRSFWNYYGDPASSVWESTME